MEEKQKLTKKDFVVDGPVKWCAGCGAYSILAAVQAALPETGKDIEDIVFVSGIGCSSRFPYYINTYGFHGLHGRAAAIASGMKVANPKLSVWQITGDGDAMAIGGNHFIHLLRRNIDINVLLFNNKIYGLTKGQYSPTTPKGSVTKTSPHGTIENPFNPGELAMGAQGTFFARVLDKEPKMMKQVFIQAEKHKGTSMIEILQNCVIFNNKVHELVAGKDVRDDRTIYVEHGKPLLFGKEKEKGLIIDEGKLKVVKIGKNGITKDDILVHDAKNPDPNMHYMISRMTYPDYPIAVGIIRGVDEGDTYENLLENQIKEEKEKNKIHNMTDLLNSGNVFNID
ncbi:MAG: 2-oxoacid:ferredoxin oxidoreductase subunit beta [Bacteroidota bacterium]|nr:2-oxoacid:ferredoxin oxidoreductase subunit beta [Bacteroidota bacterium]